MRNHSARRGDTLIEILFALAIFGAIAISSVSIMNLGLSNSEKNLEQTTVRSEINSQAEAIRFVHNAYIANPNSTLGRVWGVIINGAIKPSDLDPYPPESSCTALYTNDEEGKGLASDQAFIINTRAISASDESSIVGSILFTTGKSGISSDINNPGEAVFTPAVVAARTVYSNKTGTTLSAEKYDEGVNLNTKLIRAEGLWVVAVKSDDSSNPEFYDFYIRSCWAAPGSSADVTLGTVIRLYNPDFSSDSASPSGGSSGYQVTYYSSVDDGSIVSGLPKAQSANAGTSTITLSTESPSHNGGYIFKGWSAAHNSLKVSCQPGDELTFNGNGTATCQAGNGTKSDNFNINGTTANLYAVWGGTFEQAYSAAGKTKTDGYYTMQDMTPEICEAALIGEKATLLDVRDNTTYPVGKLEDNKCWMRANLDLDLRTTLTPEDTDITANWMASVDTMSTLSTWRKSSATVAFNKPQSYDSGDRTIGNYYNWTAAIASDDSSGITNGNASTSICPKGWRLPTYNLATDEGDFNTLLSKYGISNGSTDFSIIESKPLNFITGSGFVSAVYGTILSANKRAGYWTSCAHDVTSAKDLIFYEDVYTYDGKIYHGIYYSSGNNHNRGHGLHVRCVAK